MKFYRVTVTQRRDDIEVRATWPASERAGKRPALQKAVAAELRRWADLLERGRWEDGGSAAGPETETRILLHEPRKTEEG